MTKLVTLEELLSKWWVANDGVTREDIRYNFDWDELMLALDIYCPEAEGKNIVIGDFDEKTYSNIAVVFNLEE